MLRFVPIVRPPRTVWASIITIVGSTCDRVIERINRAVRDIARTQTPFPRQRRDCCQAASQGG